MGVCHSCHRRKGRGTDKNKRDAQLCPALTPLNERISEFNSLPSEQKAITLPKEQRGEDLFHRTSSTLVQYPLSSFPPQPVTPCPQNGVTKNALPSFTESVETRYKLYMCNSNGKHSVTSNGHNTLSVTQTKDNSCNSKCDNIQSDLINTRGSMTMASMKNSNIIKGLVSKQRKRFQDGRYDLDLSYITDKIIAMGVPADNIKEKFYRNNIDVVAKFLDEKHKDHYKIYNLCSERIYDQNKFHNRVELFQFDDHNPPKINLIMSFCKGVEQYLEEDLNNVAVIHCKAGKGRTGTMISCYLLHSNKFTEAADALNYYGSQRTHDCKGVTIPSQKRYVEYYAAFLKMCSLNSLDSYHPPAMQIVNLYMNTPPVLNGGQMTLGFCVTQLLTHESSGKKVSMGIYEVKKGGSNICLQPDQCRALIGDIKIEVFYTKLMRKKEKLFHFWFNTFFVAHEVNSVKEDTMDQNGSPVTNFKLTFSKWDLDEAHKDKTNKVFGADFKVELTLQQLPDTSKWVESIDARQRSSPASGSHSSSAEGEDSEDSLEPDENWDSGESTYL